MRGNHAVNKLQFMARLTMLPVLVVLSIPVSGATKPAAVSVCKAWKIVEKPGSHRKIVVSGTYYEGLEERSLYDPKCTEAAWVDIDLRSQSNRKRLEKLLTVSSRAYVSFEGELYGRPIPDPKKEFVQVWGRGGQRMRLVVWSIKSAKPVP